MLVYKLNRRYVISMHIMQLACLVYFSYDAYSDIRDEGKSIDDFWFLYLFILLEFYLIANAFFKRVIIDNDELCIKDIFTKKKVRLDEMEGYEVDKDNIVIDLIDNPKKKIKISVHFDGKDEIIDWLWEKMTDSEEEIVEEDDEVEEDEEAEESEFPIEEEANLYEGIGETEELRAVELNKTKRYVFFMNIISCLIAAWILFYTKPYEYSMLTALVLPVGLLVFLKLNRGLITVDNDEKSRFSSFQISFIALGLGLFLRGFLDFYIMDYYQLMINTLIGAAILVLCVFTKPNEFVSTRKAKLETLKVLIPFMLAYSLSAVVFVNCYYDNTILKSYKSKVLSKRIYSGKSTSYYVELTAWGKQTETDEIDVGKERYHRINIGDSVNIDLYNGLLGVPWYDVTERK